jgi:hypothetical protein
VTITGDDKLYASFEAHLDELAAAVNQTATISKYITDLGSKSVATFQALGDVGIGGASCVASTLSVVGEASVSIKVSVSVSASVTAGTT